MRAAIQSVRTTMSRPMSSPCASWAWYLPNHSSLSLTSSTYLTLTPVSAVNFSSVGCFFFLTSM
jgi:hypothetical protein